MCPRPWESKFQFALERRNHGIILGLIENDLIVVRAGDGKAAAEVQATLILGHDMEMQMRVGVAKGADILFLNFLKFPSIIIFFPLFF